MPKFFLRMALVWLVFSSFGHAWRDLDLAAPMFYVWVVAGCVCMGAWAALIKEGRDA
jgi:hypothetical protein